MTSRRAPSTQLALTCEGMAPDEITVDNIEDVFDLWVDRIEDLNAAIAAHNDRESLL